MYKLTEQEIISSLLINNKDHLIKRFTILSDDEKDKLMDFFRKHSNLENRVDWNKIKTDQDALYSDIQKLIVETEQKRLSKEKKSKEYSGEYIDWESHDCMYIGEDDCFVYIAPLTHEGAMFCDSVQSGGAGAKWCIGQTDDDFYWRSYTYDDKDIFIMMYFKNDSNTENTMKRVLRSRGLIDDGKGSYINDSDNKIMLEVKSFGSGRYVIWSQVSDRDICLGKSVDSVSDLLDLDVRTKIKKEIQSRNKYMNWDYSYGEKSNDESQAKRSALEFRFGVEPQSSTVINDNSFKINEKTYIVLTEDELDDLVREEQDVKYQDSTVIGYLSTEFLDEDWVSNWEAIHYDEYDWDDVYSPWESQMFEDAYDDYDCIDFNAIYEYFFSDDKEEFVRDKQFEYCILNSHEYLYSCESNW